MISNLVEALGFGFITLAAYEFSGRVAAFAVLGAGFLFVGFVLHGVQAKLPKWKRQRSEKPKAKLVEKPLTNEEIDLLLLSGAQD